MSRSYTVLPTIDPTNSNYTVPPPLSPTGSTRNILNVKELAKNASYLLSSGLLATGIMAGGIYLSAATMGKSNYEVDRGTCTCDCWDRKFKGPYFNAQKQYKAVYFNFDNQTIYLVLWTLYHTLFLQKYIERCLWLMVNNRVRWIVLVCACISYYQVFYNWWASFNYINDRFFELWPTQLFFNITEIIPSITLFHLTDSYATVPSPFLALSLTVSFSHIYLALEDQGWAHLVSAAQGGGESPGWEFLNVRDLMFLLGDSFAIFAMLIAGGGRWRWSTKAKILTMVGGVVFWKIFYAIIKAIYGYR
ncbi:hypothetical protein BKA69DRAFT_621977 [Paraphysoderma sedebokerense]|nr:hypothetical protein BKA69DRAFT_621977 [Paraphysoderma sedebokerense]